MKYIIAIGIVQALVAAGLLLRGKGRHSADGLLIALVVCIATHLSIKFIIFNFINDGEVRRMMNTFLNFCYAPLLYLYTIKVIRPAFIPASRWYVFLPLLAGVVGYFSVVSVLVASPGAGHKMLGWYNAISFWSFIPGDFAYCTATIYLARRHLAKHQKERRLIIQLSAMFLAMSAMALLFYLLMLEGHMVNLLSRSIGYSFMVLMCIRIIAYRYGNAAPQPAASFTPMLQQPLVPVKSVDVTGDVPAAAAGTPEIVTDPETEADAGVRRNLLSEEDMQATWQQLEACMLQQAVYTDADLSLDKLSLLSRLSKYHISETLNRHVRKSFYQYINEYRINRVIAQLQSFHGRGLQVNMLTLAYDAGFKSKSSFNRYFKELTGYTPSGYLRSLSATAAV